MVNIRYLALATIFAILSSCASIKLQDSPPSLSYPGLSVYGLNGKDASQLATRWYASVRMYRDVTAAGINFITVRPRQYATENTVQDYIDYQLSWVDLDDCIIIANGETYNTVSIGTKWKSVSAGEEIFINTPTSLLYKIRINHAKQYRSNGVSPPLPKQTTLMLPGETFPAIAAYPISDTEQPVNRSPKQEPVTENTVYRWDAATDPSSYIEILFKEYDNASGKATSAIRCNVFDDGEFELPQDVLDYLSASDATHTAHYARVQRRLDFIDGVIFLQEGYSLERF